MPYQPNYCCHCGEKVERDKWRFWTSSRFCENCEGAFQKVEWMPKLGLAVAAIGGLFGFGSYLKTPEKPLSLANNQFTASAAKPQTMKNEQVAANSKGNDLAIKPSAPANVGLQNQKKSSTLADPNPGQSPVNNLQNVENEPVYYCGAQTKKGTPCTRKVKGGGRCWQHTGLPAILPKEKLVSSQ